MKALFTAARTTRLSVFEKEDISLSVSQNLHMYFVHMGTKVSPVLDACPHFSRARYLFHAVSSALHQFSVSSGYSCPTSSCVFTPAPSYLPLPSVHTLFNFLSATIQDGDRPRGHVIFTNLLQSVRMVKYCMC